MNIKIIDYIDNSIKESFENLLKTTPKYEPYYTCNENPNFIAIGGFNDNNQLISYVGAILLNPETNEATKIYEISGLTHPNFRNQGLFKVEIEKLYNFLGNEATLIMPVEDEYKNASYVGNYLYSEYLYVLKKEDFLKFRDELEKQTLTIDHYTAFSEDHTQFALYLNNEEESDDYFNDDLDNNFDNKNTENNEIVFDDLSLSEQDFNENDTSSDVYGVDDSTAKILNAVFNEEEPAAVLNINYTNSYATIYGVYVDEDKRNLGLGTALVFDAIEEFFSNFDIPLILNVTSTNVAAVKLYKKAGFTKTSQVDYYAITSPMS